VVGVAAGAFAAEAAVTSVRQTVAAVLQGVPRSAVEVGPGLVVAGLCLAVLTALAAAALPLVEVLHTPPLQGLRRVPPRRLGAGARWRALGLVVALAVVAAVLTGLPPVGDWPLAALLAALAVMLIPLVASAALLDALARLGHRLLARLPLVTARLASAALSSGRRRAAWAAGAVAVAVALAVAVATLVVSFRASVEGWTEAGMRADVWVRPLLARSTQSQIGHLDPEIVTLAEELFGGGTVDPFYQVDIVYRGRSVGFAGAAFDVVQHHGGVPFPGRDSGAVFAEALRRRGAVVNEPFARRFDVGTGDRIELQLPGGPLLVEVVGVFTDYSRSHGLVVVDRELFLDRFADRGPRDMALFLGPGVDAAAAAGTLREAVDGRYLVDILVNRELRAEVLAAFDRTFAITSALALVAALVAVVAVATVLTTLIAERRRELATVRVVGGSRTQLVLTVMLQSLLLGVAAAAAGSLAGLAIGVILVKVVNLQSFGWTLELLLPVADLAWLAGWVVAACLLASLPPAMVALRLQPAAVLREEG
jgi:putative ABC transport system permease protein